jgi:hypothetical protein
VRSLLVSSLFARLFDEGGQLVDGIAWVSLAFFGVGKMGRSGLGTAECICVTEIWRMVVRFAHHLTNNGE